MLTTKRELLELLNLVDDDAAVMLQLKGEERSFALDVANYDFMTGSLTIHLDQRIGDVTDERGAFDPQWEEEEVRFGAVKAKVDDDPLEYHESFA